MTKNVSLEDGQILEWVCRFVHGSLVRISQSSGTEPSRVLVACLVVAPLTGHS